MQEISIIVAMSKNRTIGSNGMLPWHLPADLKHFRNLTLDHTVIMGRKTYESIGKPLPRRRCIVISRNTAYKDHGCSVVHSLEEALESTKDQEEVFVIGGGEIYDQALHLTDTIYMTVIDKEFDGDVTFDPLLESEWQETERKNFSADDKNIFPYSFITYKRREKVVDPASAGTEEYRNILEEVQRDGKCPFCPENFHWHTEKILRRSANWFITRNAFSYQEAEYAFLIIPTTHKERFEELKADDFLNISFLVRWVIKEFNIKGGGFAMRFGDTAYTGATVRHIHAHIIVPKVDKDTGRANPIIRFPFG